MPRLVLIAPAGIVAPVKEVRDAGHSSSSSSPSPSRFPWKSPDRGAVPRRVPDDFDEADRVCKACGGALDEMTGQFEESEEVTVVVRSFVLEGSAKADAGGSVQQIDSV